MIPPRPRRAGVAALLALVVVAGACGDSAGSDAATVDELDAALRPAAQALLDARGVQARSLSFGEGGALLASRWSDSRSSGDFVVVALVADAAGQVETGALVQIGGEALAANSLADGGQPWSASAASAPPDGTLPVGFDLAAVADGQVVAATVGGAEDVGVTSAPGVDGGTVWTLTRPGPEGVTTLRWAIDGDGFLRSFAISADGGFQPVPPYTELRYEFDPASDADPIARPEIGSTLDLDSLGLPADLERPG